MQIGVKKRVNKFYKLCNHSRTVCCNESFILQLYMENYFLEQSKSCFHVWPCTLENTTISLLPDIPRRKIRILLPVICYRIKQELNV